MALKSIEEHNREVDELRAKQKLSGIACPACGDELEWVDVQSFTMPPLYYVACKCGWQGTVK